ncbi:MAG TPA: MarR family transcriptional regulator [Propionibacteriaceae bacterium]|nr:MarR family transcriptional regulator [Propionibacteriaceae bacterium]
MRSGAPGEVPGLRQSETLQLIQELTTVSAQVPHAVARRAGLSESELHSLRHLLSGPVGPNDLARTLGVTSAASSGIVDRLESRGHVTRQPHPTDKRRTVVAISDSGRAEVMAELRPMFEALVAADSRLDDAERAVVDRYLRDIIAAVRTLL